MGGLVNCLLWVSVWLCFEVGRCGLGGIVGWLVFTCWGGLRCFVTSGVACCWCFLGLV